MQLDIEPAQKLVIRPLKSPVNTKAINISLTSKLENNTCITTKVDNETNELMKHSRKMISKQLRIMLFENGL